MFCVVNATTTFLYMCFHYTVLIYFVILDSQTPLILGGKSCVDIENVRLFSYLQSIPARMNLIP